MTLDYIVFFILFITIIITIYLIYSKNNDNIDYFATIKKKHHHVHKNIAKSEQEVKHTIKQEIKSEIKQENKQAIKQEIKQEIKSELRQENKQPLRQEILQEIRNISPILLPEDLQIGLSQENPPTIPQEFIQEQAIQEISQEKKSNKIKQNFDDTVSVYEDDNIIIIKKDRLKGQGNLLNPNEEDVVNYDPYKCIKGDIEPFASVKKPRNIRGSCHNSSLVKRHNIEGVNNLNHMLNQAQIQTLDFSLEDPAAYYRDHFKFLRPELDFYYKGANMPTYSNYANINDIGKIPLEKSKDSKYPLPANFTFKNSPSFR